MKKIFILLIIVCSLTPTHAQSKTSLIAQSPKVDAATLKKIRTGKAYLVDVRTPEEFNSGHLKFAKNINYNGSDFKAQIAKLDKSKPVYLYCRSGNRSGKAADTMAAMGFATFYNIGGIEKLKQEGFPVDPDLNALTRSVSVK